MKQFTMPSIDLAWPLFSDAYKHYFASAVIRLQCDQYKVLILVQLNVEFMLFAPIIQNAGPGPTCFKIFIFSSIYFS